MTGALTPERVAQIERDIERKALRVGVGGSFRARGPEDSRRVRYDVLDVLEDRIRVRVRGTKVPIAITRISSS